VQSSGTLAHVDLVAGSIQGGTINGLIDTVGNGNSIDGSASGVLTNKGTVQVADNTQLWLLGTINNTGTILDNQVSTTGNTDIRLATQSVTLTGGGQLMLSNNGGNLVGVNSNSNTLVNLNNTISGAGQVGAGSVGGTSMTLVNATAGVINANQNPTFLQSGQLTLDTAGSPNNVIVNAGLMEATAAGGLLIRDSVVNNTGGTLAPSPTLEGVIEAVGATAVVDLNGATIEGGTLSTPGGGVIQTTTQGGLSFFVTLDGLDLGQVNNFGTVLVNDQTTLFLQGVINNTGTVNEDQVSIGGSTEIRLASQDVTLTGAGQLLLSNVGANLIFGNAGNQSLIHVNNTISGAGQLGDGFMGFTNEAAGIVDANVTTPLALNTNGVVATNAGLLEATNGGTLLIQSTVIANAGGTIASSGAGSVVGLQGGSSGLAIEGGTIAAGALVETLDRTSTVDGLTDGAVTNKGTLQVNNGEALSLNGTITNNGVIQLAGGGITNSTDLIIDPVVVLQGFGTVLMSVTGTGAGNDRIWANVNSTPFQLINVNNTIAGAGQPGLANSTLNITNEAAGVINANAKGALVVGVQGNSFLLNQGKLEATSTLLLNGGLVLANANIVNAATGTIQAVGSGGTNAFAHVDLANATIQAGTLATSNGGIIQILVGTTTNVLDGVSAGAINNTGTFVINDFSRLQVDGTLHNTGTLQQNGTSMPASNPQAFTDFEVVQAPGQAVGAVTLTGNGQWNMTDNRLNRVYGLNVAATLVNNGNTIKAAGAIGANGQFNFTNALGTLNAFGANAFVFTLGNGYSTNNALMEATGVGGMVLVNGLYINNGTMLAGDGSSITFQSGAVNTNLTEGVLAGGTWEAISTGHGATLSMTGGPITLDDGVLIVSGAGSVIQAGSGTGARPYTQIEQTMSSIVTGAQLQILNNRNYTTPLALDNFGTIVLGGGTLTALISTIEVPGLLTGKGTVNNGFINQGTIIANGGTLNLTHVIGSAGPNGGTLESNAGALLSLTGFGAGAGTIINNGSLFVSAVTQLNVLGTLSGTGAITDNGIIVVSPGKNVNDTGAVSVAGKLQLGGGTLTAGTLTIAGTATLFGSGTVTNAVANSGLIDANGGTLSMGGNVTGTGRLQVDGGAALRLGGASNTAAALANSGTVTLSSGKTLTVSGNASGNGAYVVNSTATLTLNGTGSTSGAITENGVLNLGTNAVLTVSGNVSGTGSVTVGSGGALTLNGAANSVAALTDNGTVNIGTNGNLTVTGTATVNGTIHPHGGTLSAGSLAMGGEQRADRFRHRQRRGRGRQDGGGERRDAEHHRGRHRRRRAAIRHRRHARAWRRRQHRGDGGGQRRDQPRQQDAHRQRRRFRGRHPFGGGRHALRGFADHGWRAIGLGQRERCDN
jgi:hypothetical protein